MGSPSYFQQFLYSDFLITPGITFSKPYCQTHNVCVLFSGHAISFSTFFRRDLFSTDDASCCICDESLLDFLCFELIVWHHNRHSLLLMEPSLSSSSFLHFRISCPLSVYEELIEIKLSICCLPFSFWASFPF